MAQTNRRKEWPIGLIFSVAAHLILFAVLITVKVVQYIMEPPSDFKASTAPSYVVQPPKEIKERIKRNQQSGGGGRPPKVAIAVENSTTFNVPRVDVQVSSLDGKLGSRGSGTGLGDGTGSGKGPGSGFGSGGGPGGLGRLGLTLFGALDGPGLTGYFYDLKQTRDGKPTDMAPNGNVSDAQPMTGIYQGVLRKFTKHWHTSVLDDYYRGKKPLYATQIYVPNGPSDEAAKAFGEGKKCSGYRWVVHYQGSATAPKDGTFRFVGRGDNVMVVRLNEKIVFDGGFPDPYPVAAQVNTASNLGPGGPPGWTLAGGAWFEVRKGDILRLEILLGDGGGAFSDYLLIEEKGEKYAERQDAPGFLAYPLFQLSPDPIPKEAGKNGNPLPASKPLIFPFQN